MGPRRIHPQLIRSLIRLAQSTHTMVGELERLPDGEYPTLPSDRQEVALMLREMYELLTITRELVLEECARAIASPEDPEPPKLVN
jgi:hypothetical protein